ncbi:hypothetical protein Q7P37_004484 [Cladosporium fusiforme]
MSSNNIYSSMPPAMTPEQLCGEIDPSVIASTDWYTPVSYIYEQPYLTPLPSSTVEAQQWNQYTRASIPDTNMPAYPMVQQQNAFQPAPQAAPGRPRSSPSTFGPSPENLSWAPSAGLGIQYTTGAPQPTPMTSTFPPTAFQPYATENLFETPSPVQLQQPQPRRPYQPIAPNPASASAPKRGREEEEEDASFTGGESSDTPGTRKRRRTNSAARTKPRSESDAYLIHLKETENLSWKDIIARFKDDRDEEHNQPKLQMRWYRHRESERPWEQQDTYALEQACKWYEKNKWDMIRSQMLKHGITEKWSKTACARKWRELNQPTTNTTRAATADPSSAAQFSSPSAGPAMTYSWVPLQ